MTPLSLQVACHQRQCLGVPIIGHYLRFKVLLSHRWGPLYHFVGIRKSKQFILSLYEKEDFESRKSIDWDKYVFEATVFKDEPKIEVYNHCPSDYYYAFTQDFPEHGIDTTKILSYDGFLKGGN